MGTLAKINGIAIANIAKINGVAVASIAKFGNNTWPSGSWLTYDAENATQLTEFTGFYSKDTTTSSSAMIRNGTIKRSGSYSFAFTSDLGPYHQVFVNDNAETTGSMTVDMHARIFDGDADEFFGIVYGAGISGDNDYEGGVNGGIYLNNNLNSCGAYTGYHGTDGALVANGTDNDDLSAYALGAWVNVYVEIVKNGTQTTLTSTIKTENGTTISGPKSVVRNNGSFSTEWGFYSLPNGQNPSIYIDDVVVTH